MAAGNSFYYSPIILIANTVLIVHYVAGTGLSIYFPHIGSFHPPDDPGWECALGSLLQFRKLRHKVELGFEPWRSGCRACGVGHDACQCPVTTIRMETTHLEYSSTLNVLFHYVRTKTTPGRQNHPADVGSEAR